MSDSSGIGSGGEADDAGRIGLLAEDQAEQVIGEAGGEQRQPDAGDMLAEARAPR